MYDIRYDGSENRQLSCLSIERPGVAGPGPGGWSTAGRRSRDS